MSKVVRRELINTKEREEMKVSFVIGKPFGFSELTKQVDDTLGVVS